MSHDLRTVIIFYTALQQDVIQWCTVSVVDCWRDTVELDAQVRHYLWGTEHRERVGTGGRDENFG